MHHARSDPHAPVQEASDGAGVGLLWFQIGDLRLADNPALAAALAEGPLVPFFAWAPAEDGTWAPGGASRWWLHHSLEQLARDLERRGSRLIIRSGASVSQLLESLAADTGATRLYFNRGYTPAERLKQASAQRTRLQTFSFNARLLIEPSSLQRDGHPPYRIFSAFWRSAAPLSPSTRRWTHRRAYPCRPTGPLLSPWRSSVCCPCQIGPPG